MSEGPSETATERELALGEDSHSTVTSASASDAEAKPRKKTSCKLPKSPKSPYISSTYLRSTRVGFPRSFKGTENKHFEISLVKASRQLWRGSLRQDTWLGQTKSGLDLSPGLSSVPDGTPEYLKEALGMKKPKHARSASSGYIPGTPDYKEKEEMYDEIIELKKTVQAQKCEADRMKTKLRRLEEENNRKDKQIEQLLDPSRGSEFGWVRTEQKNDNSMLISGLKQKILRLEQQCKEKDNTINKLQTDVKSTNVEEMRISLHTCYEEIQRLQTLLAKSKTVHRKSPPESREQKALSGAVLQLSRNMRELQEENWALKVDLDRALSRSRTSSKGANSAGWSRQRLVRRISAVEKKMDERQNSRLQLSQTSTSPLLTLPTPVAKESDPPKDFEHLQSLVKKLKSQGVLLQNQLAVKEEEIQELTAKVRELEGNQERNYGQAGIDATERSGQNPEFAPGPSSLHAAAERAAKEKAVRLIQSVFRAHVARMQLEKKLQISSPESNTASPAGHSGEEKPVWSLFRRSPLTFTSALPVTPLPNRLQSSPPAPTEEVESDDSDDIITVLTSPAQKTPPLDFRSSMAQPPVQS
ncbi:IQ domain-containing protein E [Varanus komodoensis]|uniref:IQ domain-containing protein E n=1 Tax=Varanus komodoensis TaxID=61221 RepID=UPI001CF7EB26|nr:IQ domain-containing protein E [Varanus komodoensis]